MSFYTSLSGLKAAQSDLSVTSNNIANVGAIGFKKSRAEFGDLISASPLQSSSVAGEGTRLKTIAQEFTQGGFQSSERSLDLAISGQGFFVTRNDITGGDTNFTRDGQFGVDSNSYVTDSSGHYLQVLPVDDSGNVSATGLTAMRNLLLPATSGQAQATSNIDISVTLPTNSELPANRGIYTSGNPYAFNRFDANSYNYSTSTTVYDSAGNPQAATIYYARTTAPTGTDTSSTWQAHTFVGDTELSADGQATNPATPLTMQFDANGTLTIPTGAVTYGTALPTGASAPFQITVNYGSATKQAAANAFALTSLVQNGYAAGKLDAVAVGADGLVTATYSNGTTEKLGKLAVANFANPGGLRQLGNSQWGVSGDSGEAVVGTASSGGMGAIQTGALEQANVDITEELVALISAQRNFQANAKAIDTANQLTQTIENLRN